MIYITPEIANSVDGVGVVTYTYNIAGVAELPDPAIDGVGDVSYVYSIAGVGEQASSTEGSGTVNYSLQINGVGEYGPGSGSLQHQVLDPAFPNTGMIYAPSIGTVSYVFSITGVAESATATEGTGIVSFGTGFGVAEIGTSTDGTGTVEFIQTLTGVTVKATLAQIEDALCYRLTQPVSVTFDATAYNQSTKREILAAMNDIVDNWASYSDLKNGADIDWGVADGTILTMTQAEFTTFRNDTLTAWRDMADRVTQKARDWSANGVSLITLNDDSSWS